MIAVQAPLGGTLFLHCPVLDMLDEDFQVGQTRTASFRPSIYDGTNMIGRNEIVCVWPAAAAAVDANNNRRH